jgi:hypothetical protein
MGWLILFEELLEFGTSGVIHAVAVVVTVRAGYMGAYHILFWAAFAFVAVQVVFVFLAHFSTFAATWLFHVAIFGHVGGFPAVFTLGWAWYVFPSRCANRSAKHVERSLEDGRCDGTLFIDERKGDGG